MKRKSVFTLMVTVAMAASMFTGCGSTGSMAGIPSTYGNATLGTVTLPVTMGETTQAVGTDAEVPGTQDATVAENTGTPTGAEADTAQAISTASAASNSTSQGTSGSSTSKPETTQATANSSTSKPAGTQQASTAQPQAPAQESQPSTPAHVHVWKDHTATKEEWVSNIVVVDDYETREVVVGYAWRCGVCGEVMPEENRKAHSMAHLQAGEGSNGCDIEVKESQQVKVGSHEEDQGHYETVSYVDYQYCDWGATK